MNALQCARYVYQMEGIRGFYRGLTASYAGISETIICFAIYESLKKHLKEVQLLSSSPNGTERSSTNFFGLMFQPNYFGLLYFSSHDKEIACSYWKNAADHLH